MIKIALVDNDNQLAGQMKFLVDCFVEETGIECALTRFSSGVDFISDYNPVYDLVFLDIDMPLMDGLETAKRLRRVDQDLPIIFVTNMLQMAIRGYEVNALDFIVKPLNYCTFEQKMKKALEYIKRNNCHSLVLKTSDGFKRVYIRDIKYIEVFGHSLIYHTIQEDIQVRGVLSKVETELEQYHFLRCNNCFLINLRYVEGFTATSVIVDGEEISISRRKKKEFTEGLADYLGGGK